MNYNLAPFNELVEQGYLRKSEKDGLILYGYTDKCTFDRHWNDYTRMARGIIFEKSTGKLIAKPFPKFFNLGEMEETFLDNLPKLKYCSFEKVDGSLGIIYHYNGKWNVATRGSLNSEQAQMGQTMLDSGLYKTEFLDPDVTYLVEIIYPENKIVVDYQGESCLCMLGAFNRVTEEELNIHELFHYAGMNANIPFAEVYFEYTIEEMIELKKTMPKDQEGFVVRFENGLRVKIKGDEYMKIAKIISQMSPLSFWEAMSQGIVNKDYLAQVPEEFRKEFEPMVAMLEFSYSTIKTEIGQDLARLPQIDINTKEGKKTLGLLVQGKNDLRHPSAMFPSMFHQAEVVDKYIMRQIRPTGNVLYIE